MGDPYPDLPMPYGMLHYCRQDPFAWKPFQNPFFVGLRLLKGLLKL
jgi:hypothetical protein